MLIGMEQTTTGEDMAQKGMEDMALDKNGRVLRRPQWYSADEYSAIFRELSESSIEIAAWQQIAAGYERQRDEAEALIPTVRCRRRLHPLLRMITKFDKEVV